MHLAGPVISLAETLEQQVANIGQAINQEEKMSKALDDLYQAIRTDQEFNLADYQIPAKYQSIYHSLNNQRVFVKGWLDTDPQEIVKDVEEEICIIQGEQDSRIEVNDTQDLANLIDEEQQELYILEDLNHFLGSNQRPYEVEQRVLEIITEFIGGQE